jgi:phenylalanyl-tRNA synthetase alpha chain
MAENLFDNAKQMLADIESASIPDAAVLEQFRIKYLGSKNIVKDLFAKIKEVPNEQKKEFGQVINSVKTKAEEKYNSLKTQFESKQSYQAADLDLTLPGYPLELGSRHPVSIVRKRLIDLFGKIGFTVAEGPEIEDDWHNFTALNTPEDHPARDMTDTFYIQQNPDLVLRSQTSPVQVRVMETQKPPISIIAPGRVYRNETITYKHHVFFHQLEGLYIDKNVSFADLKQTLDYFVNEFFGDNFESRLRPSYFPFTVSSAEMDIRPKGTTKWMEILGCGMVHPKVLENCGINPDEFTGYAFGMGIDRLANLIYNIPDVRILFENDIRFLKQFEGEV